MPGISAPDVSVDPDTPAPSSSELPHSAGAKKHANDCHQQKTKICFRQTTYSFESLDNLFRLFESSMKIAESLLDGGNLLDGLISFGNNIDDGFLRGLLSTGFLFCKLTKASLVFRYTASKNTILYKR